MISPGRQLRAVKGKVAIAIEITPKVQEIIQTDRWKLCQQRCQCPATVVGLFLSRD